MPAVVLQEGEIIKTEGATLRVEYGATTTPTLFGCAKERSAVKIWRRVWAGPGHWQNHAIFYLEEEQSIFSGDHVLGFGAAPRSPCV